MRDAKGNEQRQEGLTTNPVLSCGAELLASREKEETLTRRKGEGVEGEAKRG